jgi:hypothetical protein
MLANPLKTCKRASAQEKGVVDVSLNAAIISHRIDDDN